MAVTPKLKGVQREKQMGRFFIAIIAISVLMLLGLYLHVVTL